MELAVPLAPKTEAPQSTSATNEAGSGIQLPKQLESVKVAQCFPHVRHRWNTNEEIASVLLAFSRHADWQQHEVRVRPRSGCCLLFNRNSVRYRKDGYCWKKRKDGKTIREDHMKLKVQGLECIYGSYVHSAILPTFHRRCYWLLQNPDIVLVHYLNVPYPSNQKLSIPVMSIAMEKKEWTKEELTQQLKPMFSTSDQENVAALDESIQTLVQRLIDNQDKFKADQLHNQPPFVTRPTPDQVQVHCAQNLPSQSKDKTSTVPSHCASNLSQIISDTELLGQTHNAHKPVNFAQGVILNIGQLAKGQQVMLLTGKDNATQLSILANSANVPSNIGLVSSQNGSVSSSTSAAGNVSECGTFVAPKPSIMTLANRLQQTHGTTGHMLARSASLCDNHSPFTHLGMQRSQSQDGSSINMEGPEKSQIASTANTGSGHRLHFMSDNSFATCTSEQNSFQDQQNFIDNATVATTGNCEQNNLPIDQLCHGNNQQTMVDTASTNMDTMCHSAYSTHSDNSNTIVNNFFDELQSELMSTDRHSPSEGNKREFGHLGDSFESLQASLNTILMDVPELEQMCSDLTNSGNEADISSSLSMTAENVDTSNKFQHASALHQTTTEQALVSSCGTNNVPPSYSCSSCNPVFETSNAMSNTSLTPSPVFSHNFVHATTASSFAQLANSCDNNATVSLTNSQAKVCTSKCQCGTSSEQRSHQGQGLSVYQGHTGQGHSVHSRGDNLSHTRTPTDIASITDFSPDWAYTEGQTKVLVTGPWHASMGTYSVLMDGKVMATTLVQNGVLRCFVPGHKAGGATLQVCCDGEVISNNATFEFKERPKPQGSGAPVNDWFSVEDGKLHDQLISKLEKIESALSKVPDFPTIKQCMASSQSAADMDTCLSRHLQSLSTRLWTSNDSTTVENGSMGLSLLHLVAGLGYNKCTKTLIGWRNDNASWMLEYEVDAHSQDLNSCTPLMWACARGHLETATTLYAWNKGCLHSFNREGNLPLLVARQHGHHNLADQLEKLDMSGDQPHDFLTSSVSHESMTATANTNNYGTQSFAPPRHSQTELCSGMQTSVSNLTSTPDKHFFSMTFPNATSTPITKDNALTDHDNSDNVHVLGALHIDIPSNNVDLNEKSQRFNPQKRENPCYHSSEQTADSAQPHNEQPATTSRHQKSSTPTTSLSAVERRQKLRKRFSVDIISNQTLEPVHFSPTTAFQRPVREANSEPHLAGNLEHLLDCDTNPMLSEGREMGSPEMLVHLDHCERHGAQCNNHHHQGDTMDTDNLSEASNGSFVDVERISSDDEEEEGRKILAQGGEIDNPQPQMVHLAKQIIAAMPERIKSSPSRGDDVQTVEEFQRERSSSYSSIQSSASPHAPSSYGEALSSYGEDSGISTPMHDSLAFDEYRYPDVYSDLGTPASSLSPDSTCLPSPYSPYTFHMDSPPPTAAEFVEYFNAPATFMEKDFSQLTLSDREQRKLYEAAKVIQSAYRQYKDKQCKQQAKEREAAVLIQSYYRRYKQYAYYKKMTQAAVLIQSQFRSYYAQKRFKKSRDAAVVIQNQYRSYKEHERLKKGGSKSVTQRFRSHYQRKPIGSSKGTRVVQIVPDTEGCPDEPQSSVIDGCPQGSTDGAPATPGGDMNSQSRETNLADPQKGE